MATFITALSLTKTEVAGPADVPVFVDPELPEPPAVSGRLTLRERYARPSNYLRPILRSLKPAKPKSIGFFGGCLEYGRLPWWGVLFAMVILRIPAGDRRNWEAVQTWAQGLPAALGIKGGERSERGDSRS